MNPRSDACGPSLMLGSRNRRWIRIILLVRVFLDEKNTRGVQQYPTGVGGTFFLVIFEKPAGVHNKSGSVSYMAVWPFMP